MNEYVRQAKPDPVLLNADDLQQLAQLIQNAVAPNGKPRHSHVWSNLEDVNVSENTIEEYLRNPELPGLVTDFNISIQDGYAHEGNGREVTAYFHEVYVTLKVAGSDQTWAIGTLAVLEEFLKKRKRRGAFLARHRFWLELLVSGVGGVLLSVVGISAAAGKYAVVIAGLTAGILLLVLALLVRRKRSFASFTLIQLQEAASAFPWGIAVSAFMAAVAFLTLGVEVVIMVLTIRSAK